MIDLDTRLTNLENTITYLHNNYEFASDEEIEEARVFIFDELNDIIKETRQIVAHVSLLEDSLNKIAAEKGI